jgi:VIT1/CCC1 family predicted Fe2+/Mn2+ transporter
MLLVPDVEKMEIREIYRRKGFKGNVLEEIVDQITSDPDRWLRELVIEEIGIADLETEGVWKNILTIFLSFCLGASFSVIPYMVFQGLPGDTIFQIASGVTFGGLFIVGALKKFVTGQHWLKSGLEMLLVGAFTFLISYYIGEAVGVAV